MNQPRPQVYLHIGTRKSGTTYLQASLLRSRKVIREHGVRLAATTRHQYGAVMKPLKRYRGQGDPALGEQGAAALVRALRKREAPRHIVSLEALAEMPAHIIDLVVTRIEDAGFDVEVVLTARHWGVVIPSEWQQCVKSRDTVTFDDFVAGIRDRTPAAALFLARQDLPAMVGRWADRVGLDHVHVVAVPPPDRTEGSLNELFCGLVGLDPALLMEPSATLNQSLSLEQAEMLRRVNIALGDRLGEHPDAYKVGVREWLARGSLKQRRRTSIRLPEQYVDWCLNEARAQLDGLLALGVDLVGRPDDLLPAPDAPTGTSDVPDSAVSEVAVDTIADLAVLHWAELVEHREEIARLTAERDELRAALEQGSGRRRWLGRG